MTVTTKVGQYGSTDAPERLQSNVPPAAIAYSIQDAVKVSGLARTRLFELIKAGQIDARKCGRRTLIPATALAGFLATLPPARPTKADPDSPPGAALDHLASDTTVLN